MFQTNLFHTIIKEHKKYINQKIIIKTIYAGLTMSKSNEIESLNFDKRNIVLGLP